MGVPYLLDTDICSYFLRDRHGIGVKFQEVGFENFMVLCLIGAGASWPRRGQGK